MNDDMKQMMFEMMKQMQFQNQ